MLHFVVLVRPDPRLTSPRAVLASAPKRGAGRTTTTVERRLATAAIPLIAVLLSAGPAQADPACRVGPGGSLTVGLVIGPGDAGGRALAALDRLVLGRRASLAIPNAGIPAWPEGGATRSSSGDAGVPLGANSSDRAVSYTSFRIELPQAAEARLAVGAPGVPALFVDGRAVGLVGAGSDPDSAWADVRLAAGWHGVVVRASGRHDRDSRVVVRVLDRRNLPATGVVEAAPGLDPACGCLCGAAAGLDVVPVADGFSGSVGVRWPDRRPLADATVSIDVAVAPGLELRSAASRDVPASGLGLSQTSVPLVVAGPATTGEVQVRVRAADASLPMPWRVLPVRIRPGATATMLRARSLLAALPARVAPFAADSLAHRTGELRRLLAAQDPDDAWVDEVESDLRGALDRVEQGQDPYSDAGGVQARAYRSATDEALRELALYVPEGGARAGERLPLVVMLHGTDFGPRLTLRQLFGLDRDHRHESAVEAERHLPVLPQVPFLVACPAGHGNAGWRYLGEADVERVVDTVASEFPVDPDRVYVAGLSLGGLGAFHVGLRRPDRFAAAAPVAGFGSVALYTDVKGRPRAPWEDFLVQRNDDAELAGNGLHLPLWVVHGSRDRPERSLAVVDRYRRLGQEVEYRELPSGHEVWRLAFADRGVFDFLGRHRREARPARIGFRTGSYRDREAWWVRLEAFARHEAMAQVTGDVVPSAGGCVVEVHTENVLAMTVVRDRLPAACAGEVQVVVDGAPIAASRSGDLPLLHGDGGWTPIERPWRPPGRKRPGVGGPIEDAFYGPLLFVFGTADPEQVEVNRQVAEADARAEFDRADVRWPVKPDTEVTDEDVRHYTLVLYGNPASNRVLARIANRLPIRFEGDAVTVGQRRHVGQDVGVVFIAPNPENPDAYVLVKAGVTWRGTRLSRHLPLFLPDYVVFDSKVAIQTGGRLMDRRPWRDGGFLDAGWQPR